MRKTVYVPVEWEYRWIKRFLWFPKTIKDERRWLEWAWIRQMYYPKPFANPWGDNAWATEEEATNGDKFSLVRVMNRYP